MSINRFKFDHKFVPVEIEENNIFGGILNVLKVIRPHWSPEAIIFKVFTDGITNKLVACELKTGLSNENNIVLVRIYGNKTDLLIDRNAELRFGIDLLGTLIERDLTKFSVERNITVLNAVGLAPEVYGVFKNGLVYQYYPGVTLTVESVIDKKLSTLVACQMAKMHKVQLGHDIKKEPMLWDKIEQFLGLVPEQFSNETKQSRFAKCFGSVTKLRIEFERLKSHLTKSESPIVFAHNDLLLGNVIYNESQGTVSFIDYEYAAYNYQAFDIANHFNEFVGLSIDDIDYNRYPKKDFQLAWIRTYLSEYLEVDDPPSLHIEKVFKEVQHMAVASHFLWGIWSLVQFELSDIDFDFGRYAEIRLNKYFNDKDQVFKELI